MDSLDTKARVAGRCQGVKGDRGFGGNNGQKGEKGMTGVQGPPGPIPTTIPSERCGGPGWRKVAFIDMTDTSQNCPQGLTLTGYSKRSCGRTHTNPVRLFISHRLSCWWGSIQSSVWES